MKKTLTSMLVGTAIMAASVSAAFADTSGTLKFAGEVADTTCTVSDLNQTVAFANYDRAEFQSTNYHRVYEVKPIHYQVTGCPANVKNANLKVSFISGTNGSAERLNLGSTTARGIGVLIAKVPKQVGDATPLSDLYYSNGQKSFAIEDGSGTVSLYPVTMRVTTNYLGQANVEAGDFSTSANLELSYN